MLKARVFTVLIVLPAFLAALFLLPEPYWAVLMLGMVAAGSLEWGRISGYSIMGVAAYGGGTTLLGAGLFILMEKSGSLVPGPGWHNSAYVLSALFWVMVAPLWLMFRWHVRSGLALAVVGWVILLPTWAALVQIRALSPLLLLGLMAVIWVADTAAYFVGKRFGRHKLAPEISPGKTWEGVAGAVIAVTAYGLIWLGSDSTARVWLMRHGANEWFFSTLMLWVLLYFSIIGDLFESWMKRLAGLKDSGRIFPGHGGLLDRVDALTSTLPLAALALLWLTLPGAPL